MTRLRRVVLTVEVEDHPKVVYTFGAAAGVKLSVVPDYGSTYDWFAAATKPEMTRAEVTLEVDAYQDANGTVYAIDLEQEEAK